MDGTCNNVGGNDKCMPYFGHETPVKRPLERLRRKERKIPLKWIVKKCGGRV
jgi:hypothetical protein